MTYARNSNLEIRDDHELLSLMVDDMHRQDALYRPTNFWSIREDVLVRELQTLGLDDFRRRQGSYLSSLGATDNAQSIFKFDVRSLRYLNNRIIRKLPGWQTVLDGINRYLQKAVVPRGGFFNRENQFVE